MLICGLLAGGMAWGQTKRAVYNTRHEPLQFANILFYTADTTCLMPFSTRFLI